MPESARANTTAPATAARELAIPSLSITTLSPLRVAALALPSLYLATLTWLAFKEQAAFHTAALDLGTYDQMLWNTAHGRFFEGTLQEGPGRMAGHFSPILLALVPLYALWPNIHILFVANALGLTLSGLVLYRWARDRAGSRLALVALLAYYLSPIPFIARQSGHFRDIMLALPFASLAVSGLATRKRAWLLAGSLLLLLAKEDMGLYVATFGLFWVWRTRQWRWGLGLVVLGIAWVAIATFIIVPYALGWGSYPQSGYYKYLEDADWHNPAALVNVAPAVLRATLTPDRLPGVIRLLLPTGLLCFLSPISAMLVPPLAYLLLSTQENVYQLRAWHPVVIVPILYFATIDGLLRLPERYRRWAVGYLVLTSLAGYWVFSPGPLSSRFDPALFNVSARDRQIAGLLTTIPPQASVVAQQAFGPHLSQRIWVHIYPDQVEQAEYVVVDRRSSPWPIRRVSRLNNSIDRLLVDPNLAIQAELDGFFILRRAGEVELQYPTAVRLGNQVELMGFDLAVGGGDHPFVALPEGEAVSLGSQLRLALYWRTHIQPERPYSVAIRLINPDGREGLRHDRWPANGLIPTSA